MKTIPISAITVAPNRQRRTFPLAKLNELVESIQTSGLFNAVVLRQEGDSYVLVSGERRLRACSDIWDLGGTVRYDGAPVPAGEIPYTLIEALDPLARELAELDENIRRDDLTWQERAAAVARVAALRTEQAAAEGTPPPTTADLAEDLFQPARAGVAGDSDYGRQAIRQQIAVSKFLDDPEVQAAKTLGDAYKTLKKREERQRNAAHAEKVGATFTRAAHRCIQGDSLSWLGGAPSEAYDVILTDPPYGMGADEFGDSGGVAEGAHGYVDDESTFLTILDVCRTELFRIAKPQAHLYWFCDIDNFELARSSFGQAGWWVHRTPLIWHKPNGMRTPWPEHGPQRKWEMCLYAVKGKRPTLKIAGDVLTFPPDSNLGHAAQKPVALFAELLARSAKPGDSVIDPFCGTGTIFPAAHGLKVAATGIELDQANYGIALKRLEGLA